MATYRTATPASVGRGLWRHKRLLVAGVAAVFLLLWVPSVTNSARDAWSGLGAKLNPSGLGISDSLGGSTTRDDSGDSAAHPAKADVAVSAVSLDDAGLAHTTVVVTNHTSKTSMYLVGLQMRSTDGKTIYGRETVDVAELPPGASVQKTVVWRSVQPPTPAGSRIEIKTVDRWAR